MTAKRVKMSDNRAPENSAVPTPWLSTSLYPSSSHHMDTHTHSTKTH